MPPEFLKSTAKEVRDNVRRMQRHPSIALWAANNENERDLPQPESNIKAYSDLYFRTILANVSVLDQSRPMTGSSPSNGNETAEACRLILRPTLTPSQEPFCFDHQSEYFGDVHNYQCTALCCLVAPYTAT